MRTLLFLLTILISAATFAQCERVQDGSKYFINSEKLLLGTTPKTKGKVIRFLHSRVEFEDSVTTIFLYPQFDEKIIIDEGAVIYIKFEDESVMQIKAANSSTSRYADGVSMKQGNNGNVWFNSIRLKPTPDEMHTLLSKKVIKVRCNNVDYLSKDDEQTVISDQLRCINAKKNK